MLIICLLSVKKILAVINATYAVAKRIFFTLISSFRSSNICVSYIHNSICLLLFTFCTCQKVSQFCFGEVGGSHWGELILKGQLQIGFQV